MAAACDKHTNYKQDVVAMEHCPACLHAALQKLSQHLGNPALMVPKGGSFSEALVDFAIARLKGEHGVSK